MSSLHRRVVEIASLHSRTFHEPAGTASAFRTPYLARPVFVRYLRCLPPSPRIVSPVMKSDSTSLSTAFAAHFDLADFR